MREIINNGDKYNKLTAISFDSIVNRQQKWLFVCDCGNKKVIYVNSVKSGNTKACGCLQVTHGLSKHRLYGIWSKMKDRCNNSSRLDYKYYGARGIVVCDRWMESVENFIEDMYKQFKEGLTLDRRDNNKGYSRENCRWITHKEQMRNYRRNRKVQSLDEETGETKIYEIMEDSRTDGFDPWHVSEVIDGKRRSHGGKTWIEVKENISSLS